MWTNTKREYSSKLDHDELILSTLLYSLIWLVGFIVISVVLIIPFFIP